jgi:CubicO group peptidase (beta-lactamase class C family)
MRNPTVVPTTPNARGWRAAEIPGGNGHGDARSLARLYGVLAQGGGDLISPEGLKAATAERYRGPDASSGLPTAFGAGYRLSDPDGLLGPSTAAYGHTGWGGAFAFADPANGLGVAYVMNRMLGDGEDALTRHARLIDSIYSSL